MTYKQMLNEAIELYLKKEYQAAFDLVTEYGDLEGNPAQIANFQYSFLGKLGRHEEGFTLLKDCIMNKGYWYDPNLLLEDEDLEGFRTMEGFDALVEICKTRQEAAMKDPIYRHTYVETTMEPKLAPLMVALHGNQENMRISEWDYKACLELGMDALFIQSGQADFYDAYTWEDYEAGSEGVREVMSHYVDHEEVVLSGFSGGGQVALWSVVDKEVKCNHLLLMAPWLPNLMYWEEDLEKLRDKNLRITIICGDRDEDCYPGCQQLYDKLMTLGLSVDFQVVEGLSHEFPVDFKRRLMDILK